MLFKEVLTLLKDKEPIVVMKKLNQLLLVLNFGLANNYDKAEIIKLIQKELFKRG